MGPMGPEIKNDYADKSHQQLTETECKLSYVHVVLYAD
jgi:hypothetical protein